MRHSETNTKKRKIHLIESIGRKDVFAGYGCLIGIRSGIFGGFAEARARWLRIRIWDRRPPAAPNPRRTERGPNSRLQYLVVKDLANDLLSAQGKSTLEACGPRV
jgi:hypothetical protein